MKKLLKALITFMIVTIVVSALAVAGADGQVVAEGSCGDQVSWTLSSNGTNSGYALQFSGIGNMIDWSKDQVPWKAYREDITSVTIDSGITSIGNYAFYDCQSLETVTIPETITKIGNYAFSKCTNLTNPTLSDNITIIGYNAFDGCKSITAMVLPSGLTTLNSTTFQGCSSLESITIPNGVTEIGGSCFCGCTLLESVELPVSVTKIGDGAFSYCGLTSITIPKNVTSIGDDTFGESEKLERIDVDTGNQAYCSEDGVLFSKDKTVLYVYPAGKTAETYTVPSTVKELADWSFHKSQNLSTLILPEGLERIGSDVFWDCSISSVNFPDTLTDIGERCFINIHNLKSITVPGSVAVLNYSFCSSSEIETIVIEEGVKTIKSRAFSSSNAKSPTITLPCSVKSISADAINQKYHIRCYEGSPADTYAKKNGNTIEYIGQYTPPTPTGEIISSGSFSDIDWQLDDYGVLSLTTTGAHAMPDWRSETTPWYNDRDDIASVVIGNGITSIGNYAFYDCQSLETVTIPETITKIGNYAFSKCTNLTNPTLSDNITIIGYNAFDGCKSITAMVLPSGLTTLNSTTFQGCSSLESITIPNGVTEIGGSCFCGCTLLESVELPVSVTKIGDGAFSYCGLTSITIPKNVTSIGDDTFGESEKLERIDVDTGNQAYCSEDGVLFSKDKTVLYVYPAGKTAETYTVPSTVKELADWSFHKSQNLSTLILPEGLERIGSDVFWDCSISSVNFPDTLTDIGEGCFVNIYNLKSITVPGSVAVLNKSFCSSSEIETIVIEEGVKTIKSRAFSSSNAKSPTITLPCSLKSISPDAINQKYHIRCYKGSLADTWAQANNNAIEYIGTAITIAASPADTGGIVTGGGLYPNDSSVTLIAAPAEGFAFVNWMEGETVVSTEASYTFTATADRTLVANFVQKTSCITYEVPEHGSLTVKNGEAIVSSGNTVPSGANLTIISTPDEGYCLSGLSYTSNGETTLIENGTFTMPENDVTVTAIFVTEWTALQNAITSAADGETISVSDYAGADQIITALSTEGALIVVGGKNITLDLAGCTIDRGLAGATATGHVITVNGTLTIDDSSTGGKITGGNTGTIGTGGIYVNGGTLNIAGGSITGNHGDPGGGIVVWGLGSVHMTGGSIAGNAANGDGGGVFFSGGSFEMSGGSITANTASGVGGGIIIIGGTVSITGGNITNNSAVTNGNDINVTSGSVELSGAPAIGDIYLNNGTYDKIWVLGKLSNTEKIRVKMHTPERFTVGYIKNGNTADPSDFFVSGNDGYQVGLLNNDAVLGISYSVTVADVVGGSITPERATGKYIEGETVTLTIAPSAGYELKSLICTPEDGDAQALTVDENGVAVFLMPDKDVTVTAVFAPIPATAPTITKQPTDLALTYGYPTGNVLTVGATTVTDATYNTLSYQWYSCEDVNKTNPQVVSGATDASYTVPNGKNAGTTEFYYCVVTATRSDNSQMAEKASDVATVTVGQAELTITVKDQTYTYDGQSHGEDGTPNNNPDDISDKISVSGLQDEDSITLIMLTGQATDAGVTDITLSGYMINGVDEDNYNLTMKPGKLTIKPKPVSVTVTAVNRDYIAGNTAVSLTAGTVSDVVAGDTVTADISGATGTMDSANAGDNKTVTVTGVKLAGADAGNYELSAQPTGVKVTISKAASAPAMVTANDRFYDGTEKALVTITGDATGGSMQYALGTADKTTESYAKTIPTKKEAGTYYVWYKVVGDENHADSSETCIPVTIRELGTIAANAEGFTGEYDGKEHGITVTVTKPESGADVKYGTAEGTYDKDTSPTLTDTGTLRVYFVVTAANYNDYTGSAVITIIKNEEGHTHTIVIDKAVAATCTETGLTEGAHCSVCNAVLVKQEVTTALGHDWDAGVVTKEATAKEEGVRTFTCTRCGEKKEEAIAKLEIQAGWQETDAGRVYVQEDGTKATDWVQIDGSSYCFDENGVMRTGWYEENGYTFYLGTDGKMATGDAEIDGKVYHFNDGGACTGEVPAEPDESTDPDARGWIRTNGGWAYIRNDGTKAAGWLLDGSTWYYMNDAGVMQTGWVLDSGSWYYMESSGAMATGWIFDGAWYYMNPSGAMATGWVFDGGVWYYMKSSGAMATGWVYDGGAWYYMSSSGAMVTGWIFDGSAWYYMKPSGAMQTGWFEDKEAEGRLPAGQERELWYWFDDSGAMAIGWKLINNQWEMFADSGEWLYTYDGK